MTTPFNDAPPAEAPKQSNQFFHFDPLPEGGPQVMTLVATNFIPEYTFVDQKTKKERIGQALELFWGLLMDGKAYFVKTLPMAYSIHEKANWSKAVKAMTGSTPEAGSRPAEYVGKAAMLTIENVDKVSKKGTKYRRSQIAGYSPIPKQLVNSATPLSELLPKFEAVLAAAEAGDEKEPF